MKKIYLISTMATVLLGLAACSSDDLASIDPSTPTSSDENVPISFGTYLGNAKSTRAGESNISSIDSLVKAGGFGIFATNTETKYYNPDNGNEHTIYNDFNYMFNQQVKGTAGTPVTWSTSPVKYWPNKTLTYTTTGEGEEAVTTVTEKPQFVTFFAYAPYCELSEMPTGEEGELDPNLWENSFLYHNGTDNGKFKGGILAVSNARRFNPLMTTGDQDNWYSMEDPVLAFDLATGSQTDLLWGTAGSNGVSEDGAAQNGKKLKNNVGTTTEGAKGGEYAINADLTKMKTDGKVSFAFKHALARIGGHKANDTNDNTITIDAVPDAVSNGSTPKQLEGKARISLKWLAIEVLGRDGDKDVVYPTKGFFNLATGLWGGMATDPTTEGSVNYENESYPVYVLYPNGITEKNKSTYLSNISPYLNDKTIGNYTVIPLNSTLTVNEDGSDSYEDYISTTEESIDIETGNVVTATSAWYESTSQEGSGTQQESTTKKVPNAGVTTTATSVYVDGEGAKDAAPLLIIPNSTVKPKLRVVASYDIVTPDSAYNNADGHKGYTKVHQIVGQDVTFTNVAQPNKKYNLHIHLGVTSIKVDATVADWDKATTTGEGGSVVEDTQDINLPANVSGDDSPSSGN